MAVGIFSMFLIPVLIVYLIYSLIRYRKEKNKISKALFFLFLAIGVLFFSIGQIVGQILSIPFLALAIYYLNKWKKIKSIRLDDLKPLLKNRNFYIWISCLALLGILSISISTVANDNPTHTNKTTQTTDSSDKTAKEATKSSERKIQLSFYDPVYDLENSTYKLMITADKNKKVTIKDADGKVLLSDKPNQDERIEFTNPLSDKTQIITISDGDTVKNTTIESKVVLVEKQKREEEKKIAEQQENERKAAEEAEAKRIADEKAAEQERIAAEENAKKTRLESGDITYLTDNPSLEQKTTLDQLANMRFKQMFPYKGSKIHSIMGVIQEWTLIDDHWYYKAQATIVNAFGAKMDQVIEITIKPTGPKQGEVDILAY